MEEKDILKEERLKLANFYMNQAQRLLQEEQDPLNRPKERYFRMEELELVLGVSPTTIQRLRKSKSFPVVHIDGKEFCPKSKLINGILEGKIIIRGYTYRDLLERINFYCADYVD